MLPDFYLIVAVLNRTGAMIEDLTLRQGYPPYFSASSF